MTEVETLYYAYLLSGCPFDIVEQRLVRSAVQERLQQDALQRAVVHLVEVALIRTLHETLRTLAPDVDAVALAGHARTNPDVTKTLSDILVAGGLTIAQLEARGVRRDIKQISRIHRQLLEAQANAIRIVDAFETHRAALRMRPPQNDQGLGTR